MTELGCKKKDFYTSMYLECICDTNRKDFLEEKSDSALESHRRMIRDKRYDVLLDRFVKIMNAKMAILFHEKNQQHLEKADGGRNIVVLSRSTESCTNRIGILRSELLDYYRNYIPEDDSRPSSILLLDIKDTARIVEVASLQRDPMVCEYERMPCVISYIHLDYYDQLSSQDQHIYFAFFYEIAQKDNVPELLEYIRRFLAFRYDLKQRIQKDFNGNLYGKRVETAWSNAWLSIEKAGAHTDSSEISRLVKEVEFKNTNIMDTLFALPASTMNGNITEEKRRIFRFIYNINISMYYRAVISEGDSPFFAVDDIIKNPEKLENKYHKIEDVLRFSQIENPTLLYGTGEVSDDAMLKSINEAILFGRKSKPMTEKKKCTGGIPKTKIITVRRRYLQAFLVDILHNMKKYGKQGAPARIFLEAESISPGYLVFCNEVEWEGENGAKEWCVHENYRLKQATEFDHAVDPNAPKGMSLACLAHCMKDYGKLLVRYKQEQDKVYFEIKLPIIQIREEL